MSSVLINGILAAQADLVGLYAMLTVVGIVVWAYRYLHWVIKIGT